MYNSEHEQDKWLDENVFKGKRGGIFFEAGAIDGIITSNSLYYEQELGWTGLCAEANPEAYEGLKKNRTCATEHCAIWDRSGCEVEFLRCKGGLLGWSGIVDAIEPQHRERIEQHVQHRDVIRVPALTLEDLLNKHNLKQVDYLTLDLEGAEYFVLKAFPFDAFDIEVFDIEDNFQNYPIEALMRSAGYSRIVRLGPSDIYRRNP